MGPKRKSTQSSWYGGGGSWRGKASAVGGVSAGEAVADTVRPVGDLSGSLWRSHTGRSSVSEPGKASDAATATSSGTAEAHSSETKASKVKKMMQSDAKKEGQPDTKKAAPSKQADSKTKSSKQEGSDAKTPEQAESKTKSSKPASITSQKQPATSASSPPSRPSSTAPPSTWLGWWSGPSDAGPLNAPDTTSVAAVEPHPTVEPPQCTVEPPSDPSSPAPAKPWFGTWTRTQAAEAAADIAAASTDISTAESAVKVAGPPTDTLNKSTGWTFWSRDTTHEPAAPAEPPPPRVTTPQPKKAASAPTRPNLVLPLFRQTFSPTPSPSYVQRITRYIYPLDPLRHVQITPPPRIKTAVAVGVHGYFPAPLLQKVLGQPTGTSVRFANHAAEAVKSWVKENQSEECQVETIALEGEGFIADRVSTLWKLLLEWTSQLQKADFILVACHSQGVPVAIMLVSKLVQLGCLSKDVRISICAMAGVNLGPFSEYKSRWLGSGSAAELFDFGRSDSKVTLDYTHALQTVLAHGVRIVYVGSLDDQLVSLESSTFSTLSHPLIYRAVFVDGRVHVNDFVTGLVAFALKLRNLGISDHGLIRELSLPLAGSLYGGEGHSRVYDDVQVYQLAVEFGLETNTDGVSTLAPVFSRLQQPSSTPNPYILPWAMRGMLEEPRVKSEMAEEVNELLRLFDEWRPVTKALKDVRFRLEAVKGHDGT